MGIRLLISAITHAITVMSLFYLLVITFGASLLKPTDFQAMCPCINVQSHGTRRLMETNVKILGVFTKIKIIQFFKICNRINSLFTC